MSTLSYKVEVGFCTRCSIIRQDVAFYDGQRVVITHCACTAAASHKAGCFYVSTASSWIDVGGCDRHGRTPCLECDCTCEGPDLPAAIDLDERR